MTINNDSFCVFDSLSCPSSDIIEYMIKSNILYRVRECSTDKLVVVDITLENKYVEIILFKGNS